MLKIVKFGGSSLADAEHFKKVYKIVKADPDRRYVIPSAPGKRYSEDTKVTDMLYNCYELASEGLDFDEQFCAIEKRFTDIINDLGLNLNLSKEFAKIRSAFENAAGRDYAASRGEYLNGIILANYLGFEFVDAAKCVRFNDNGSFNLELTIEKTAKHLAHRERAVIPGFYGKMPNDTIKTFSRGGSDITGSLVARGVKADLYENWTDVNGFLVADPRVVHDPEGISEITYKELRELSYMGASVLHEDAIFPVSQVGIPINIRNTNEMENPGTMIVKDASGKKASHHVTGIAGKKGFSIINVEKAMMNNEIGFIRRLLESIEELGISVEHIPSGIDTVSIVVDQSQVLGREKEIEKAIVDGTDANNVTFDHDVAVIAVVGRGMIRAAGTAARVFKSVAEENINLRMIDQGSSEISIIIGVAESAFEDTMVTIYNEFFRK